MYHIQLNEFKVCVTLPNRQALRADQKWKRSVARGGTSSVRTTFLSRIIHTTCSETTNRLAPKRVALGQIIARESSSQAFTHERPVSALCWQWVDWYWQLRVSVKAFTHEGCTCISFVLRANGLAASSHRRRRDVSALCWERAGWLILHTKEGSLLRLDPPSCACISFLDSALNGWLILRTEEEAAVVSLEALSTQGRNLWHDYVVVLQ